MDNRKQESFDQRFLSPLKNRPGLEPDEKFIEKLRSEITNGNNANLVKKQWRWPILIPMALAGLLFSVLTASFLGTDAERNQSESAKLVVTDKDQADKEDGVERDIYKITASNDAFEQVYRSVAKSTGSQTAARELVYYLDALEKGDEQYIRDVLLFEYYDNKLQEVIEYYQSADFSTIEIEMVESLQNGRSMVTYSFHDKEKNDRIKRRLLLDLSDGKHIKVFDAILPASINANKDDMVREKAAFLKENFKLGMTEKEVLQIFGNDYEEFVDSDAEDGSIKDWRYQFFMEKGTSSNVPNKSIVDYENLVNQNIGIQFWIGWSSDNKVMRMSMFYTLNGKVNATLLRADGSVVEEVQKTGEIILDSTPFTLDEKEKAVYDLFKNDKATKHLKNLPPLSISKLYIQAQLDDDPETQYALYTTRSERIMWSKEEHIKESKKYQSSKEEILTAFQGLQTGKFVKNNDEEGYIKFENKNGMQGFSMSMDPDGVWKVNFMPIQ